MLVGDAIYIDPFAGVFEGERNDSPPGVKFQERILVEVSGFAHRSIIQSD